MTFKEYLWSLLTRPFKLKTLQGADTEIQRWVSVLGDMHDDAKETVFRVRRAWVTATSWEQFLELLGTARGIQRYTGETDDELRKRIESAFKIYQLGGTVPGIKAGLTSLGFPDSGVIEKLPGRSWAEFAVRLGKGAGHIASEADYEKIDNTLFLTKAAHTMPAYIESDREYGAVIYMGIAAMHSPVRSIPAAWPKTAAFQRICVGILAIAPPARQRITAAVKCQMAAGLTVGISMRVISVRYVFSRRDD